MSLRGAEPSFFAVLFAPFLKYGIRDYIAHHSIITVFTVCGNLVMDRRRMTQLNRHQKQQTNQKGIYMEKGVEKSAHGLRMHTKSVKQNRKK